MLFSIAFCALMWSAPQVVAWHWYYTSTIQPSPSLTLAQSAILPTPSIQIRSKLSRGHCGSGQVSCRDGNGCIPAYWDCDWYPDCSDGSDEDHCGSSLSFSATQTSSAIQASSSQRLLAATSTVQYCYYYWQFRCRNGQCISRYNLCNGRYDCYDGSDEDWYQCQTSQISSSIQPSSTLLLIMSSSVPTYCGSWQFRCRNGQCISKNKLCNNYTDCGDQSDEHYSVCRGANMTKCQNKLDLGFMLDSSGSVGYTNFQGMKLFVKDLTDFYKLGPDETRVSVMSFSSSAYIHISFSGYFADKNRFDSAVDGIVYSGGGTATAEALSLAYNDMFTSRYGARGTEVKKVLVILTDGQSNTGQVSGPARQLKNSGVVIFSVGIGQSLSMQELQSMASDPVDQHVTTLNNFTELERQAEHMSSQTCNAGRISSSIQPSSTPNMIKCQNKLDLGFVLDGSGSVGYTNFQRMKLFVKDLTDFYMLGSDKTRVSVMSFSNSAYIHIWFSSYFADKNGFDSTVDRIGYNSGGTATAEALIRAYNDMFTSRYGARGTEVKKVLVILTDGHSNTGQVSGPARQLKNSGVVIFSVGIGQSLSMQELRSMASDPVDQHVITLNNFSELELLAEQLSFQTCNAPRFQVLCDNDFMTAVFVREDLPKHVNIDRLYFRYRSCRARWNSTHVIAKASLTGCGTVFSKTEQTLFFTNLLSEEGGGVGVGVITRDDLFRANLTCTYPRKRTVGSFNFAQAKQRLFVRVGGQSNFSLSLDVFKSSYYRQPYTPQDYPVLKSLSDNLYIQYYINTSSSNLVVRAETCRATPTNHAYASPQYVFISNGCDRDKTIRHYTRGLSRTHRFSVQAFRFLSEHRFVYLHCDLVVCHGYDYNSTCARSTTCSKRRDVEEGSDDASSMYSLSFGPIMQGKESTDQNTEARSGQAMNTTLVGSLIGFGCLSLVLIGALIYMINRSRRTRYDPAKIVHNNEKLSMQNVGYIST